MTNARLVDEISAGAKQICTEVEHLWERERHNLSKVDYHATVQAGQHSVELEKRGVLPHLKIDGVDAGDLCKMALPQLEKNGKALIDVVKGLIKNNPELVAKAASALPDGTYPLGDMIKRAESLGLISLNRQQKDVLEGIKSLTKNGNHFEIERCDALKEKFPNGTGLELGKHISFDLSGGANPTLEHVHGLSASKRVGPVDLSAPIDTVRTTKQPNGRIACEIHTPGGWNPVSL